MVKFSDFSDSNSNIEKKDPISNAPIDKEESIYNETAGSVRQMLEQISQKKELDLKEARGLIEKLVNNAALAEDKILFLTTNIYLKDYLLYHTVNVIILAIKMGAHLEYSPQLTVDLGVFALLHGMDGADGTESQEIEEYSAQTLAKHKFIQQFIQARGIQEGFLKEALSIIALLDVYESLTHNRAYRPKFAPYEVLKAIISTGEEVFSPKMVKEIIKIFTIYPLGSTVRLNTEEVAQVIRINHEFPLRPEVLILTDSQGKDAKEKKTIDLAARHNIFIKEVV